MIVDHQNPAFRGVSHGKRAFANFVSESERGRLRIPDYQRGRVWTNEQKRLWMGFVLSGAPLPAMFIQYSGECIDIIDGQQRLVAMLEWHQGVFPAWLEWSNREVWCQTEVDRRRISTTGLPCGTMPETATRADALRLYLAVNTAGAPHTNEELDRVRSLLRGLEGGR